MDINLLNSADIIAFFSLRNNLNSSSALNSTVNVNRFTLLLIIPLFTNLFLCFMLVDLSTVHILNGWRLGIIDIASCDEFKILAKVLLCVWSCLRSISCSNIFFYFLPIFTIHVKSFHKATMFFGSPTSICNILYT